MPHEITISLPLLVLLATAGVLVVALIAALITRYLVLRRVRQDEIRAVANHLHSLYRGGHLHALRYKSGTERVLARGTNTKFEVPVRNESHELAPSSFIGIESHDLHDALEHLRKDKRYQTVDWHEDGGENYHELKLRPEFLRERQPRA